jgi:hypothetical protein
MTLRLCGGLLKDAAGDKGNVMSEVHYGNTSVEVRWITDERKEAEIFV